MTTSSDFWVFVIRSKHSDNSFSSLSRPTSWLLDFKNWSSLDVTIEFKFISCPVKELNDDVLPKISLREFKLFITLDKRKLGLLLAIASLCAI